MKPKLLLHTCCGPCAIYILQTLAPSYDITVYFYNPNIDTQEEYQRRKLTLQDYCFHQQIKFINAKYDFSKWNLAVKNLEKEPERGRRCFVCFSLRLEKAAQFAKAHDFDFVGTTLAISPYKDSAQVEVALCQAAQKTGIKPFLYDWKAENAYAKARDLVKKEKFYVQKYCGCKYSKTK